MHVIFFPKLKQNANSINVLHTYTCRLAHQNYGLCPHYLYNFFIINLLKRRSFWIESNKCFHKQAVLFVKCKQTYPFYNISNISTSVGVIDKVKEPNLRLNDLLIDWVHFFKEFSELDQSFHNRVCGYSGPLALQQ